MKKAIIILPTFNGAKYLSELLDSLFAQTYSNIEIYARDDCSSDDSARILKKYANKKIKGKKLTLMPNHGESWGYPACFIELLRKAKDGDYYFWCDQDDVWLPNKVENAIKELSQIDANIPAAYFGAYYFCDKELNITKIIKPPKNHQFKDLIYDCWTLGFNLSFNKALYNALFDNSLEYNHNHDLNTARLAAALGTFICSDEPSAKYRRQEGAMTFYNHSWRSLMKYRIKHFLGDSHDLIELKGALATYREALGDKLDPKNQKLLTTFTVDNLPNYFKRIFYPHRLRSTLSGEAALRIFFILGRL